MQYKRVCKTCNKEFEVKSHKNRAKYCSIECRPPKKTNAPDFICQNCGNTFRPRFQGHKYCSKECKSIGFKNTKRKIREQKEALKTKYECQTCGKIFIPKKDYRNKYCSHECFGKRYGKVINRCVVCDQEFEVAYRFRGTKTCSKECLSKHMSFCFKTGVIQQCEFCKNDFYVPNACVNITKYCSHKCAMNAMYGEHEEFVTLICENTNCKKEFVKPFYQRHTRFCSRACAASGEYNAQFGKIGFMTGKPAWNRGLTAQTDERLRQAGTKISIIIADKFVNNEWKHGSGFVDEHYVGTKNNGVEIYLRSTYESIFVRQLEENDDIISWEYEPVRISYKFNGGIKNYVPDFMIIDKLGVKRLIEIKPESLLLSEQNIAKFQAAQEWCEEQNIIFEIVSEDKLHL